MAARLRARVQAQLLTRHGSFQASEDLLQLACRSKPWPAWLQAEMRSNWAGETGAVAIYRGAVSALPRLEAPAAWSCPERAAALRGFVEEHLAAEEAHLSAMEVLCPAEGERSLLPAASFGWALGYVSTAARGDHGMYVTTRAVESFVEEHYGDQIQRLERELRAQQRSPEEAYRALLGILRAACADEVAHKEDDAAKRAHAGPTSFLAKVMDAVQFSVVYWGSRVGAAIAKRI
ncbi:unnamed protein product [Effrenium voratum]|nr:unnamed protein product [Effrenium voratum]